MRAAPRQVRERVATLPDPTIDSALWIRVAVHVRWPNNRRTRDVERFVEDAVHDVVMQVGRTW